jgi:predicted dehydrogenase
MADVSMKYYREPSYYKDASWRGSIAMDGGGALINQGIHGVDLLRFLCGDIKTVHACKKTLLHQIEGEDTLCADFEFKNGGLGVLTATTSSYPGQPRRIEICGTQGSMTLEESALTRLETTGAHAVPKTKTTAPANTSRDPFAFDITLHIKQLEQFTRSIIEGSTPALGVREAAGTLDIIFAIYESAACGRIVEM